MFLHASLLAVGIYYCDISIKSGLHSSLLALFPCLNLVRLSSYAGDVYISTFIVQGLFAFHAEVGMFSSPGKLF